MKKYIIITVVLICFCAVVISYAVGKGYNTQKVINDESYNTAESVLTQTPTVTPTAASTTKTETIPSPTPTSEPKPYTIDGDSVLFKERFTITFKSAERRQMEYLNNVYDVAIIKIDFTNNSAKTDSYAFTLRDSAFQNGVELEDFNNHDLMPSDCNTTKDVRPGSTVEVTLAYKLTDTSDMEFEIGSLYSDEQDRFIKTYTIK